VWVSSVCVGEQCGFGVYSKNLSVLVRIYTLRLINLHDIS